MMNTLNTSKPPKSGKMSLKKRLAVVAAASLLVTGAFATVAYSGGGFFGHGKEHSQGHRMGFFGMGGHGMGNHKMGGFMRGDRDPAKMEKRLDKKLKHLAIELDATEDQRLKLKSVIMELMTQARPLKRQLRETRKQVRDLLTQPQIDREAIEKLRLEKIALVDNLSKKITTALGDAGEVLSQEQRVKLGEIIGKFKHRRRGWNRG